MQLYGIFEVGTPASRKTAPPRPGPLARSPMREDARPRPVVLCDTVRSAKKTGPARPSGPCTLADGTRSSVREAATMERFRYDRSSKWLLDHHGDTASPGNSFRFTALRSVSRHNAASAADGRRWIR
jgi:hypothetical protein